jgi:nondiscriminating aspartyl-tRNA synthetase
MTSDRVLAIDLAAHIGQRVSVAGWLHRRRELKSVTFLIIRDRTGLAQVVLPASASSSAGVADLTEETVVLVSGLVAASSQAPAAPRSPSPN